MMALRPAVFLDKDGTLVINRPFNVDPGRVEFTRGAAEALRRLDAAGFVLCVVSNQAGVAFGRFDEADLVPVRTSLLRLFEKSGARLSGFYYCPHHPDGNVAPYAIHCACRKPEPGLVHQAARDLGIDLARSWFIGDILDDVEAGKRAGCRTIHLDVGNETEWRWAPERQADRTCIDLFEAAQTVLQDVA